jgi:hypothetical protein
MAPEPCPLLARTHLSFDFQRGTIIGEDTDIVGSLRWCRRPGARFARDLGYFDDGGEARWWLRPTGFHAWSTGHVLTADGTVVGDVSPEGLCVRGAVLGVLEQQRFPFYLPEWHISGDTGWIATVRLERLWVTGETRRRELWHLRLSEDAQGAVRYLAAASPYLCWWWYHSVIPQ